MVRHVVQVAETTVQMFITNDRPNVAGLVLAGSADFKTELSQSDMFDQRLQAIILSVVDVSYGAAASAWHDLARALRMCLAWAVAQSADDQPLHCRSAQVCWVITGLQADLRAA